MSWNSAPARGLIGCGVLFAIVASAIPGRAQDLPSDFSPVDGFIENRGQWDAAALFRGTFGPLDVWLQADGWTLEVKQRSGINPGPSGWGSETSVPVVTTRGAVIRMRLEGSNEPRVAAKARLAARHNWFVGRDPAGWTTDVPSFGEVRLEGIRPGVTAIARRQGRRFEYDLILEPGAEVAALRFGCEGQDSLLVDAEGALVMRTRWGDLRHSAPVAWAETADGAREPVACEWRTFGEGRCGFAAPGHDPSRRLVIDPGIIWSTILGGPGDENPGQSAMVASASFDINITGYTSSAGFPTTPGVYQTTIQGPGTYDAFVSRFSASGTLLWSSFLGGTGWDWPRDLALGPNDTVTIVGSTSSSNFPTVSPYTPVYAGVGSGAFGDGFLATFNPAATGLAQLTWSTFLGGSADDRLNAVSVDSAGIVTAAGWTFSQFLYGTPPPNPFQGTFQGYQDGIIARLNPALLGTTQLLWFTFAGGSFYDSFNRMVVAPSGFVVVQGSSQSTNYPVVSPYQANLNGPLDIVVSVFDPFLSGSSQLVYSTFLGGGGSELDRGVAVDPLGRVTVAGWTSSPNFPTTPGAYDTSHNGGNDAFIARLDTSAPPANQLVFSTFVGGSLDEGVNDFEIDPAGGVRAVGSVQSPNFPTTAGAYQTAFQGGSGGGYGPYDCFAFALDPTGSTLSYATYIGGTSSWDFAYGITRDPCGGVFISGLTHSPDFPATSGAYSFGDDVFLLRMELLPAGVTRYGFPTPGCAGRPEIGVTSVPQNGNASFGITLGGAPQSSNAGVLGISHLPLSSPLIVSALAIFIDPASPALLVFPASSNANGSVVVPLPLPVGPGLAGITGFLQFGWGDPCAVGGFSGSCGMQVTIQ